MFGRHAGEWLSPMSVWIILMLVREAPKTKKDCMKQTRGGHQSSSLTLWQRFAASFWPPSVWSRSHPGIEKETTDCEMSDLMCSTPLLLQPCLTTLPHTAADKRHVRNGDCGAKTVSQRWQTDKQTDSRPVPPRWSTAFWKICPNTPAGQTS